MKPLSNPTQTILFSNKALLKIFWAIALWVYLSPEVFSHII